MDTTSNYPHHETPEAHLRTWLGRFWGLSCASGPRRARPTLTATELQGLIGDRVVHEARRMLFAQYDVRGHLSRTWELVSARTHPRILLRRLLHAPSADVIAVLQGFSRKDWKI